MQSLAGQTLEFEVMVTRAARQGWIDVPALSEAYARLAPTSHRHLDNPRKVDVEAVVMALRMLPTEIVETERLLFVPRLDAFPHEPIAVSNGVPAGRLNDGTLLVEAPLGAVSLTNIAAALCVLHIEIEKADGLLPPELRQQPDEEEEDDWDDEPEDEETHPDEEGDLADEDGDDADVEPDEEPSLGEPEHESDELPEDLDEDEILATAFSHLAFAWGTDVESIRRANGGSGGAFLQLLLRQAALPEVDIHAELEPRAIYQRQHHLAERLLGRLAEMGLANRPIHLWIGSGVVTECLSPYPRELRDTLRQWAELRPEQLGPDLQEPPPVAGEDVIYATAHDFLRANPQLDEERDLGDRTVGLQRHQIDGLAFESIDLARIDPTVCDARITDWDVGPGGPILLRIPPGLGDPEAGLLRGVLEALGANIISFTLVMEGSIFGGSPGAVVLPHLMVRWAGEQKLWLPSGSSLQEEDVEAFTDLPVRRGAVLSVPSAAVVSAQQIADLQRSVNVCAVEVGGAGLLTACSDALWGGQLPGDIQTSWAVVGVQRIATGRPSVMSLAGLSAVAIARLRALVAPMAPEPEPPPPEPEPPRPRGPSPRAIRIKA